MVIEKAKIPDNYQNVFVEYAIKKNLISTDVFKTNVVAEKTQTPVFNYKMMHSYDKITQGLLEYLMTAKVYLSIYYLGYFQSLRKLDSCHLKSEASSRRVQEKNINCVVPEQHSYGNPS